MPRYGVCARQAVTTELRAAERAKATGDIQRVVRGGLARARVRRLRHARAERRRNDELRRVRVSARACTSKGEGLVCVCVGGGRCARYKSAWLRAD